MRSRLWRSGVTAYRENSSTRTAQCRGRLTANDYRVHHDDASDGNGKSSRKAVEDDDVVGEESWKLSSFFAPVKRSQLGTHDRPI